MLCFDVGVEETSWFTEVFDDCPADEVSLSLLLGPSEFESYARILALPDPIGPGRHEADLPDSVLDEFPADVEIVKRSISLLQQFTTTPNEYLFAFWDGWPYDPKLPAGQRIDLGHHRCCAVAKWTLGDWTGWASGDRQGGYPPAAVWPTDRAWCLAYDVDSHFAGVGASAAAIVALLDSENITVRRTERTTDLLALTYT